MRNCINFIVRLASILLRSIKIVLSQLNSCQCVSKIRRLLYVYFGLHVSVFTCCQWEYDGVTPHLLYLFIYSWFFFFFLYRCSLLHPWCWWWWECCKLCGNRTDDDILRLSSIVCSGNYHNIATLHRQFIQVIYHIYGNREKSMKAIAACKVLEYAWLVGMSS